MSVVAVKVYDDKISIGADSIRVYQYTQEKEPTAKLLEVNNMVIGHSGKCIDLFLLASFAKTRKPKEKADEDDILDYFSEFQNWAKNKQNNINYDLGESSFIIIYEKKVYVFENYFIRNVETYFAIGAGRNYALSALYLGEDVKKAIKVSCELSIYCEEPINLIEIKKTKRGKNES